jgi:hypothetical protein
MIDGWPVKVGIAGILLGVVWGVSYGIERAGSERLVNHPGFEGALVPEVAEEIEPIRGDVKHNALVALSVPQVRSIDPGSVRVSTPGYTLEDAQIRPILEYKKNEHPRPKSVLVVLDNSRSMVIKYTGYRDPSREVLPSDPEYRRLDACRLLLESLSQSEDKVAIACFPCRKVTGKQEYTDRAKFPFELVAPWSPPLDAADKLESLREQENGATPLFNSVEEAVKILAKAPAGTQKVLVLLTDGMDTSGPGNRPDMEAKYRAVKALRTSGIETYAIGLGHEADIDTLQEMASTVLKADDATALNRTFKQILHQMSREVVQIDVDVTVGHVGKPIPAGQPIEITYRSGGKLYKSRGTTQP